MKTHHVRLLGMILPPQRFPGPGNNNTKSEMRELEVKLNLTSSRLAIDALKKLPPFISVN